MMSEATTHVKVTADGSETIELTEYLSLTGQKFYGRAGTEDLGIFQYVVDHNEYKLPPRFRRSDVIIDIGAHIGSFSYAALLRGAGKVFAYEAHPANHAVASENLARFNNRVICRNRAVWRSDEPPQLLYNDPMIGHLDTGGLSLLWNNVGVPVETTPLDDILSEASDGFQHKIRLLKLDCEGSEYPILFTSKHLEIVEEICGEYHEIAPEVVPERAKVKGVYEIFDRYALRDFLEERGWSVELQPMAKADGLFHARRRSSGAEVAETRDLEIDVAELKNRIREAVAGREAEGNSSFINVSTELYELLSRDDLALDGFSLDSSSLDYFPVDGLASGVETHGERLTISRFTLQPEFSPRDDDRYHVRDLLLFHDAAFVWNAYRALLKREPDETGFRQYLEQLRSGRFNKIDILASLRYSPEGRSKNVEVEGLALPSMIRRAYRLPLIGYLLELAVGLARLPVQLRSQRQIESHLIAQQERIIGYINGANQQMVDGINNTSREMLDRLNRMSEEMQAYIERSNQNAQEHIEQVNQAHLRLADSLSLGLNELSGRQKEIARLQHEQVAALFREQQEMIEDRRLMKDAGFATTPAADARTQPSRDEKPPLSAQEGTARRPPLDKLYASFEDRFRGTVEEVRQGLRFYLPLLREAGANGDVLDIGCGRGEWLELLKEEGVGARGVESNSVMAERCRERGLEVVEADALAYLRGLAPDSLRAITAFHLIEHLDFDSFIELLDEALRTLKVGGLVIFETPNPKNLVVGACNFYSDPTHRRPLFPETVQFILSERGFARVHLEYLHPVNGSPFTARQDEGSQMLDSWFFSPRDFAVIGWKEPRPPA
ncbi:MAG TPA: FkbM family methyltransferase [Pyrinomonadaceae bacterium]|nr:FkbM family methyltransferase [Pyrinomonadaceae bacterium]